jgi:hypothetical protein
MRVKTEHSSTKAKEQETRRKKLSAYERRELKFNSMLDARNYDPALKMAERMPDTLVCFYISHYIDKLLPLREVEEARKVARLFGRSLELYLLSAHNMDVRDKPYKAGRR